MRSALKQQAEAHDAVPQDALLGEEIRTQRKARGRSLSVVADSIGRAISFVSQLERGNASASIADLKGIAQCLGVPFGWSFAHDEAPPPERGKIVRAASRRRLGAVTSGLMEELLSPDIGGAFEVFLSTFEPGAELRTFTRRATEEEGYLVRGVLDLWSSQKRYRLNSGVSFRTCDELFRGANPG